MKERDANDLDIKLWQQERNFWIPRIQLILASNSLLFLGYVQLMTSSIPNLNQLGFHLSILAFLSNLLFFSYFYQYEQKLNNFERSMIHKLPWEYRKKPSSKIIRYLSAHLGRSGYRAVIFVFMLLWFLSGLNSAGSLESIDLKQDSIQHIDDLSPSDFIDLKDYRPNSGSMLVNDDSLTWNPSKNIRVNLTMAKLWSSSTLRWVEAKNKTDLAGQKYDSYALQLISPFNWSEFAIIKVSEYIIPNREVHSSIYPAHIARSFKDNNKNGLRYDVCGTLERSFQENKYKGMLLCLTPRDQFEDVPERLYIAEYTIPKGNKTFLVDAVVEGNWDKDVETIINGLDVDIF
jgi:hypothetical protein